MRKNFFKRAGGVFKMIIGIEGSFRLEMGWVFA